MATTTQPSKPDYQRAEREALALLRGCDVTEPPIDPVLIALEAGVSVSFYPQVVHNQVLSGPSLNCSADKTLLRSRSAFTLSSANHRTLGPRLPLVGLGLRSFPNLTSEFRISKATVSNLRQSKHEAV